MASFDSDDSSGDDSGAEEYETAGQSLNDFEKSERLMPLAFRRRAGIVNDYAQLRRYLRKKMKARLDDLDAAIDGNTSIKEYKKKKKSKGELEGANELLFSPDSTTAMTTANGKMRKAQAL